MQIFQKVSLFSSNVKKNIPFQNLPLATFISQNEDILEIEGLWRRLYQVNFSQFFSDDILSNILTFWPAVYEFKDASGQQVFKKLAEVVLRFLSIPISNATVERVFSVMNIVKTKRSNRMKLKTIESLLRIRLYNSARKKCCKNLAPTQYMLELFNSNIYNSTVSDSTQIEVEESNNDINEIESVLDLVFT